MCCWVSEYWDLFFRQAASVAQSFKSGRLVYKRVADVLHSSTAWIDRRHLTERFPVAGGWVHAPCGHLYDLWRSEAKDSMSQQHEADCLVLAAGHSPFSTQTYLGEADLQQAQAYQDFVLQHQQSHSLGGW